jgi:PPOX class probable F420-dependent enzyme
MELPDDVVRWVATHFSEADRELALARLHSAQIHGGEPASPRLLRCVAFGARGDLKRLEQWIGELRIDWRDVIMGTEYVYESGKNVRVHDFNQPMDARNQTPASTQSQIPPSIQRQKYISLTTFRKTGAGIATPVWFGEEDGKLYVMTRSDMGKTKRIRNNPQVRVAPCTMRGTVTGAEFAATARILPPEHHSRARQAINRKYWMARIPLVWARTDTYIEISFS